MVNSYKKNKVTGNKVHTYMRNKDLESHTTQMKQTDFSELSNLHGQLSSEFIKVQK